METPRDELKQGNKQQIVQLISGMANISVSDEKEEGKMLTMSAIYSREEELMKKTMEVREKVEAHLRRVVEDAKQLAEICKEFEGLADPVSKEVVASVCDKIDWVNKEYKSLAWSCLKKEKKYKQALEALEIFIALNQAPSEPKTKLLEMVSDTVVTTDHSEISTNNDVQIEKENEDAGRSTMDGLRKTTRNVQKPDRFEHSADHIKKGKRKGKAKKRV